MRLKKIKQDREKMKQRRMPINKYERNNNFKNHYFVIINVMIELDSDHQLIKTTKRKFVEEQK